LPDKASQILGSALARRGRSPAGAAELIQFGQIGDERLSDSIPIMVVDPHRRSPHLRPSTGCAADHHDMSRSTS
jgi:hypothetical protein